MALLGRDAPGREIGSLLRGVYDDEGRLSYAGSVGTVIELASVDGS